MKQEKTIIKTQKEISSLYTILFEFDGGTFISQIIDTYHISVFDKWAKAFSLDHSDIIGLKNIDNFSEEVSNDDCVALNGLSNVWCKSIMLNNKSGLINVIKTESDEEV